MVTVDDVRRLEEQLAGIRTMADANFSAQRAAYSEGQVLDRQVRELRDKQARIAGRLQELKARYTALNDQAKAVVRDLRAARTQLERARRAYDQEGYAARRRVGIYP
jgi:predicted  nucleic acid-binding Zn-ribbon protein